MSADRMDQIDSLIHHAVAELLLREAELPTDSLVTVTHVETTRDLRHATVYVTVMPDGKRISTMKYLNRARPHIQKALGKRVKTKFTPKIRFRLDAGEITAQGVYDIFDSPGQEG